MSDERIAQLEAQVLELRAAVSGLAKRQRQTQTTVRRTTNSQTTVRQSTPATNPITRFAPEDEVLLASGTASESGTLDLSSYIPSTATLAYVRYRTYTEGNTESAAIEVRPSDTGAYTTVSDVGPGDSDGDSVTNTNAEWTLLDGLAFDYNVTAVLNPDWSITLLGYA